MAVHVLIRNRDIRITQPGIQKDSAGDCIDLNRSKHLRLLFIAAGFIETTHGVQNVQHLCDIFVSIHMNSFPIAKYSGLQVFYAATPGSCELAEAIRSRVVADLQPDNRRQSKQADGSIRLLDSAASTAVLVECGFLSNVAECEKISSLSYQRELSFSIFCGIMDIIKGNGGANG